MLEISRYLNRGGVNIGSNKLSLLHRLNRFYKINVSVSVFVSVL